MRLKDMLEKNGADTKKDELENALDFIMGVIEKAKAKVDRVMDDFMNSLEEDDDDDIEEGGEESDATGAKPDAENVEGNELTSERSEK